MKLELTKEQMRHQAEFRAFVQEFIVPQAERNDQEEYTPPELIKRLARIGYLGAVIPQEYGGLGLDMVTFGLLNEELGRGCSSIRSLLTVHSMVAHTILKWGSKAQKALWLPRLAMGETLGAFGLSEPHVGSDAKSIETSVVHTDDAHILQGRKKWITYGQIADLFLIFACQDTKVSAFLLERNTPGFSSEAIKGIYGTRASMLAELRMEHCTVPREHLIGGKGFGLIVATSALDIGRYSVAWGCVGIGQACLDAVLHYTTERVQFGVALKEHQLIQQMVTDMLTNTKAARLLCMQTGHLKDAGHSDTIMETWIAKYFASTAAARAANDAVQIHGANGCSADYPVQRYLRDAKIMEIIEGSNQIQQITIANYGYQEQHTLTAIELDKDDIPS
jgi:alkylation response protein AidB-like acyl-CoA dehydrogenase